MTPDQFRIAELELQLANLQAKFDSTKSAIRHAFGVSRGEVSGTGKRRNPKRRSPLAAQPKPLPDGGTL